MKKIILPFLVVMAIVPNVYADYNGPQWRYEIGTEQSKIVVVKLYPGWHTIAEVGTGWLSKTKKPIRASGFFPKDESQDVKKFDSIEEALEFMKRDMPDHLKK